MLHARPQHPDCSVRPIRSILTACSRSLVLLLVFAAPATWACDDWLAKTVAITGAVERKSTTVDWQQLQVEQTVCPGDSVRVGPNSRAALYLRNNSFVRLDENSLLDFPAQQQEDGFLLGLSQGFAHFISRIVNRFEVSTPYVNAVVEGTEFIVSASPAAAGVAVMEGKVKTYNDAGTESITSGQQVQATSRTASLTRINVPSASRVEWAIHYPPVLTLQNIQPVSAEEKARLDALIPFLQQNRPDLALQSLEQNPVASPALDLARASLLLAVGGVDEFDAVIPALLQGPQAGTAHALQAVADAARNRAEPALASAHKAVELAPQLAASHIALSYAQQASLQLDDALASAKKATDVEPANALAWLRLVELRLTQGDIGAAKKALAQIDKLPPEQQQPQVAILSAKGFVNLFSLKLKAARDSFQDALKQDSADPQNHLGLGLALLRDGKLEDGRRQLEYAVSLDPLRSTLRSYLGRAYFEEKRDGEAIKQWDLAKQFDPNDPTPYFYTGVHKLFANDPIGAVDELEKSKELNDKRDIYRSETLLQSDAASRSATLARAYDEVGYDQGVLLNGWDAIRRDPTNSEGHRLLADKYAGDSRYESARASELLQSQLWQPLSAYPLQPQLSETNIAVVEGNGPQRPGFNEYHSLFTQNGVYGMANGYGGSDDTWADDLVGSFLAGPIAVSLGQYHFESDGWRENADQEQDAYSGFVQWELLPGTGVQLESGKLKWDRQDLAPRLFDGANGYEREQLDKETNRIGLMHVLDPSNALVLSAATQRSTVYQLNKIGEFDSNWDSDRKDKMAEVQIRSVLRAGTLVYGIGYSDVGLDILNWEYMPVPNEDDPTMTDVFVRNDLQVHTTRQQNAYLYYFGRAARLVEIDLGLAYDRIDDDITYHNDQSYVLLDADGNVMMDLPLENARYAASQELDQWSPKVGVGLHFSRDLYLRAALFKSFRRFLTADRTIEPTVFLGFNQLYEDDGLGAEAMNAAIAIDYQSGPAWKMGASYMDRGVESPVFLDSGQIEKNEYDQRIADAHITYLFRKSLVLSLNLRHDYWEYDGQPVGGANFSEFSRFSVPVGVEFFGWKGLSAGFAQTYYEQEIQFSDLSTQQEKNAWTTDVFTRYRFAERLGRIEIGVKNLSGEDDQFVSYDASRLAFYPGRFVYGSVNFNF